MFFFSFLRNGEVIVSPVSLIRA